MLQSNMFAKDVLVSIKPEYAFRILNGQKTIELRRKFPETCTIGGTAYIYTSSPVMAVTGRFKISDVRKLTIEELWTEYGEAACISERAFFDYFSGISYGYAIVVEDPEELDQHIPRDLLKEIFNFTPPQSFRYLAEGFGDMLQDARLQISN